MNNPSLGVFVQESVLLNKHWISIEDVRKGTRVLPFLAGLRLGSDFGLALPLDRSDLDPAKLDSFFTSFFVSFLISFK